MNRKSILFLFLLSLGAFQGFGQIVSTESFNAATFPPTGWSLKPTLPLNPWLRQAGAWTNPTASPHSGAAMARFRRNQVAGTQQLLVTRAIDYTNRGSNAANLDFWMFRDSLAAADFDSVTVWVNSTDTLDASAVYLGTIARNRSIATPDTQSVNGWYHFTYAIPTTFTGTTTHFIFEGTSQLTVVNQGSNIYLDDVSFDEFPPVCTGIPNVGNIVTPTPVICGGSGSAVLGTSAPISGVTGITYNWESAASATGPFSTAGAAATLNTGVLAATTYFQLTVNCSFSGLSYTTPVDSIVVSSNTPPVVTVTPASDTICTGSTTGTQLVASGAAFYLWTPATTLSSSFTDTVIATPTANTQYFVIGTDSTGCKDTASVNVFVANGPAVNITASPNDTVCSGSQVILNSLPGGGATGNIYAWSDGTATRRDTIIATATAVYAVVVTNAAGCSNADTITVVATPGTVANFGYTNSGNTFSFHDSTNNATSWTWTFGDGNSSTLQHPVYTYSAPGSYLVQLKVTSSGCGDDSLSILIVIAPASVYDIKNLQLSYYPNPVQNYLNIDLQSEFVDEVIIRNKLGQKMLQYQNTDNNQHITLDTGSLAAGMYFAELYVNGHMYPVKFIKSLR